MAQPNNKRLYILLGILGISILYLILSRTVLNKNVEVKSPEIISKSNNRIEETKTISNNRDMVMNKTSNVHSVVKKIQFDGDWESDPFYYLDEGSMRSLRNKQGQYNNLKLSGISLLRDQGYTIINSVIMTDRDTVLTASILKEGDEFDGFHVVKIAFDHVILRKGNRNIRLELDE